jgi:hypothetical protein
MQIVGDILEKRETVKITMWNENIILKRVTWYLIRCSLFHWHITTLTTGYSLTLTWRNIHFPFFWLGLTARRIEVSDDWNYVYLEHKVQSQRDMPSLNFSLDCFLVDSSNQWMSRSWCLRPNAPFGILWAHHWSLILELLDALEDAISLTLPYLAGQGEGCQKHESWHGLRSGRAQGRGPCRRKVSESDAMSNSKFIADW